jgi:hypothetical protein
MLKYYVPVPITEHAALLGPDFSKRFETEMREYYSPFIKKNRLIQIAKETWEYGVADSIDHAVWVGAGKNVVDVVAPGLEIDVKGISIGQLSNTLTTEASFLQNHKVENDGFVTLFKNQDYQALKQMFVDPWIEKVKGTNNLHLLAIVREKETNAVYYCLLRVVDSHLTDEQFVAQMALSNSRSVDVPLIDLQYGKTYIYISKRRLEIRLNCEGLKDYMVYSHHSK